ncbi:MAG: hypothetical protein PHX18_08740 [Candidatus Gastranaerophilales bacterium]|nr:hypothetical protein [Candidatus Gastranaerophilales bacterium]
MDIPDAAKRAGRFDQKILVTYPGEEDRKDMITKLIKFKKPAHKLLPVVDKIVNMTEGCSYADISSMINSACRRAIINDKKYAAFEDIKVLFQEMKTQDTAKQRKIGIGI